MRVLTIRALSEDGWAIVESDETLHMLRPPYNPKTASELPKNSLMLAVTSFGFRETKQNFSTHEELVAYLRERYVSAASPDPNPVGPDIVAHAPIQTVIAILARIQMALGTRSGRSAAEAALLEILKNDRLMKVDEIRDRATRIMAAVGELKTRETWRLETILHVTSRADIQRRYPRADKYYGERVGEISRKVAQQGQVFSF